MVLTDLGWNHFFAEAGAALDETDLRPARVAAEHRAGYDLWSEAGGLSGEISGKLRHTSAGSNRKPVVGDWVGARILASERKGLIQVVLPRRTCISRTTAGRTTDQQIIAANVDHVFIVVSLGDALNLRRIERYLLLATQSGAKAALILTKTDLCPDVPGAVRRVLPAACGMGVHTLCGLTGEGIDPLNKILGRGQTAALIGPSGVGKSTLINRWARAEWMAVQDVRASDQKGRHTTTHRQMLRLPTGGLIIDTPGMRELQLWAESGEGLRESFADVEALAVQCRFSDCRHETEPGCAIQSAILEGELDPGRLNSHRKLQTELRQFEDKADKRARARTRKQIKAITKKFNDENHRRDQG